MAALNEVSQDQLIDLLQAVLEAVNIPHAATVGDGEVHDKILLDRVMVMRVTLEQLFEHPVPDATWSARYLRQQLALRPAEGYRLYSELAADPKAFYASLRAEHEVIGSGHVDG